jgi:hypothetical protein
VTSHHAGTPPWPAVPSVDVGPTIDHVHRLAQIAGKYTLDQAYEPNWGNIPLAVTGRGFTTPTLRREDVIFRVDYDLVDGQVTIAANTGRAELLLRPGSVADFFSEFVSAAASVGLAEPGSTIEPEIADAPRFDADTEQRPYEADVARWAAGAFASASTALTAWQAVYRGHRPHVGIMWGGFDLSATRYRGRSVTPPADAPMFQRNGMTEEVVALGFVLGDDDTPPYFYGYISPPPANIVDADLGAQGASYDVDAGLAKLPWDAARRTPDPEATVVAFADALWQAAVDLGGWDADLVIDRYDGWAASRQPMFRAEP